MNKKYVKLKAMLGVNFQAQRAKILDGLLELKIFHKR